MTDEPIPDELCVHVELGAEMTGGWFFAADDPPKAVGMCHECIVWCQAHLLPGTPWAEYAVTVART